MMVVRMRAAAALGVIVAGTAITALLGGARPARAQDGVASFTPVNKPWRIKIGGWIPSNGNTRDGLGYSFLAFGASYDFRTTNTAMPHTLEAYVDYFNRDKTTGDNSFRERSEGDLLGFGLAERFYFTPASASDKFYVGAGVGIYNVRAKIESPTSGANRYKTSIGGKFMSGAEISNGLFGEVSYDFVPEPTINGEHAKLSGTEIRIGYRF